MRWADAFRLNENFLTAAIFARLLYFPSEALSKLLPVFAANPGEIKESGFWPSWSVKAKNGTAIRVEPDERTGDHSDRSCCFGCIRALAEKAQLAGILSTVAAYFCIINSGLLGD